jgi:uncharacterized protein (DUF2062 family)
VLQKIRHQLDRLAATEVDPARTAAAIALGVFLSFSPFLGLQIVLGLAAAFAFRLSRVAVLVGLCANLPWIMVPWYMLTTAAAASVIGVSTPTWVELSGGLFSVPIYDAAFLEYTGDIATGFLWPFLLGPTVGAIVLAVAAYFVSFSVLVRRRRRLEPDADSSVPPFDAVQGRPFDAAQGPFDSAQGGPAGNAEERAADRHVHDPQRARLES